MIPITPIRHGKLTGIHNEPPKLNEISLVAVVYGIPFALVFAFIYTLL